MTTACAQCGAVVTLPPSDIRPRNFCNHGCFALWKRTQRGAAAGGWKSGERHSIGRVWLLRPDHHRADHHGYVARAWIVAEQKLGRPLAAGEVVHHEDEDKLNDAPENLVVYPSESEHQRHHGRKRGGINGRRVER